MGQGVRRLFILNPIQNSKPCGRKVAKVYGGGEEGAKYSMKCHDEIKKNLLDIQQC